MGNSFDEHRRKQCFPFLLAITGPLSESYYDQRSFLRRSMMPDQDNNALRRETLCYEEFGNLYLNIRTGAAPVASSVSGISVTVFTVTDSACPGNLLKKRFCGSLNISTSRNTGKLFLLVSVNRPAGWTRFCASRNGCTKEEFRFGWIPTGTRH